MRRRTAYVLVAAAAALPRLAVLLHERSMILAERVEKSDRFAQTFVAHGTFGFLPGQPSAWTQPLYGWFLIPIYWLFGRTWAAVGLLQIVVAVGTALLVLAIGRRFLSERWAVVAAVAATLNPYLVWHDVHVNREVLDQLLVAALVLITLRAADHLTMRRAALLGVLSGLAILGNTRLFALPLVLVGFVLWHRGLSRRTLGATALVFAVAGLTVLPWLVRNRVEIGCFALTTDGRALWKANNPGTHHTLATGGWIDDVPRIPGSGFTPEEAYVFYLRDGTIMHIDECKQMSFYEHQTFSFWVHQPGEKARLLPQAARMLWSPHVTETGGSKQQSVARRWIEPAYTIGLYILAIVGIWFLPPAVTVLGLLLLAYNTVATLAFAGATRYRVPWDFLLALAATAGAAGLLGRVRSPRARI